MSKLHIYPTSRAIRTLTQSYKDKDALLPTLMRMDEFEHRAVLLKDLLLVDPLERILLLRKAADFREFGELKLDISLVRFFTKSDAIFKFYEELSAEAVDFEKLAEADAYAEFDKHLAILEQLLINYQSLLQERGLTDKSFIPHNYTLNEAFVVAYESIDIYLEGYLSHYELELLSQISKLTRLTIHYHTSKFNYKMKERFAAMGIELPSNSYCQFDLGAQKLIEHEEHRDTIGTKVYVVEQRLEQITLAFVRIEEMVRSGIEPEQVVLILPDESFKEQFVLFDKHNNLNFAMGYEYSNGRIYKSLDAIYRYWQGRDAQSIKLLDRYGIERQKLDEVGVKRIKVEEFFAILDALELHECELHGTDQKEKSNSRVEEKYIHFSKVLSAQELSAKEWLFLWLKSLSQITLDDVRGGRITVMGVLETRGVSFDGVVIVDFNDSIVPASSSKDQFLSSSVRAFAGLPTKHDREALQKQYYKRLLEQSSQSSIIYSSSDNKLPSKFLYELGLDSAEQVSVDMDMLYSEPPQMVDPQSISVPFDASSIVWSASRLKTYLECKQKYYYRYIQKIEAKPEEELNEGAFLHKVLEHLFRDTDHYEQAEEILKKVNIILDELLPYEDSKTQYRKLLYKSKLNGFAHRQIEHFSYGWRVAATESEYQQEIGGLRFKGRIDRIDQTDTHTLVLDYKSGSTQEAQKSKNIETLTDLQMSIYHQMLQGKYKNINLAFIKIFEDGKIEEIKSLEEKNQRLSEVIIELKQTKELDIQKCEDLQRCKWCEFALMCGRGEYP